MPNNENCPSCLEDLMRPSACASTKSGVVTEFMYGFKDDVQTFPSKVSAALRQKLSDHIETEPGSNLVMKPGKRMFRIVSKKDNVELKYELQGESGARSFKGSLECNIPGFRAQLLGFLAATKNDELIILAKTRTGEWHLLGDADEGVEYESATATSGKAGTDANGSDVVLSTSVDAPTVYMGDIDSLLIVGGSPATITAVANPTVSGGAVTMSGTATENDSTISKVGFRYRKEGQSQWNSVTVTSFSSGTPFTKSVTPTDGSGDYMYYAYMVVDGHEVYSETYIFTV